MTLVSSFSGTNEAKQNGIVIQKQLKTQMLLFNPHNKMGLADFNLKYISIISPLSVFL